jgi:nucleotide-binding universal stress UspA family protein
MRRILVGIDGSEGSEYALNKALMLIDEYGELILLAVIPSKDVHIFLDDQTHRSLEEKAKHLLDDIKTDIGEQDFLLKPLIRSGSAADVIIDVANEMDVDLIVLGSRGTGSPGWHDFGSVANKVVQFAHKPVMVVR